MEGKARLGPYNIVVVVLLSAVLLLVAVIFGGMAITLAEGPQAYVPPAPTVQADGEPGPSATP